MSAGVNKIVTLYLVSAISILMMFLTRQELTELTGYKNPSAQRRWLHRDCYLITQNRVALVLLVEDSRIFE
jgi:hypothetical protein